MNDDLRLSHRLTPDDLRRLANVVVRQTVLRPRILILPAVEIVLGVVFLIRGQIPLGIVLPVLGIVQLGLPFAQRRRIVATFAQQGMTPGTLVTAEYFADHFVVAVNGRPVTRMYRDVQRFRLVNGIALITVPETATPMMLPAPLVPAEARRLFAAAN